MLDAKRKSLLVILTLFWRSVPYLQPCRSKNETGNTDTGSANEGNGLALNQI